MATSATNQPMSSPKKTTKMNEFEASELIFTLPATIARDAHRLNIVSIFSLIADDVEGLFLVQFSTEEFQSGFAKATKHCHEKPPFPQESDRPHGTPRCLEANLGDATTDNTG